MILTSSLNDIIVKLTFVPIFFSYAIGIYSIILPILGLVLLIAINRQFITVSYLKLLVGLILVILNFPSFFMGSSAFQIIYPNIGLLCLLAVTSTTFNIDLYKSYISAFMSGVLLSCFIGLYQYFIDPTVFGFSAFKASNEDTWGTSTFRLVGLLGSPQHNAFVFSLGLALMTFMYSNKRDIIKFGIIVVSGILTLSTFFGGSLLCVLLFVKYLRMLSAFALVLIVSLSINFVNTKLEGFSIQEVWGIYDRLTYQTFHIDLQGVLFGSGIGLGSQGVIDRLSVLNTLESESSLIIIFYERGIFGVLLFAYILFHIIVNLPRKLRYLLLIIFVASFVLVPVLTSPRGMLYLLPFAIWSANIRRTASV